MRCLPWVLLSRRTAFHAELLATPSEAVFGEIVKVPGDLTPTLPPTESYADMLKRVKANAHRPAAQTALHKTNRVYLPSTIHEATHVYIRRAKVTPLGPKANGPFRILERIGNSCLKLHTGQFTSNGSPRTEIQHWRRCIPVTLDTEHVDAQRPKLGRPSTRA